MKTIFAEISNAYLDSGLYLYCRIVRLVRGGEENGNL